MNTFVLGVLIIGAATYLSVAGALAFRKLAQKTNTDYDQVQGMADPMLNVVATLFSILLGFLVAASMDKFASTQDHCEAEAQMVADIYGLARGFDDATRIKLQDACKDYCQVMIKDEWPAMDQHKTSPRVWPVAQKIWDTTLAYEPDSDRQINLHTALIDSVRSLGEERRYRMVAMRERLSPALWIVVIGSSIILMSCTFMFFVDSPKLQALMVALVALSLTFNVLLLAVYSNPFSGDLKIQPLAFELAAQTFARGSPPLALPDESADKKDGEEDAGKTGEPASAKKSAGSAATEKKAGKGSAKKNSGAGQPEADPDADDN
jgi:hypothetical protein